MIRTVATSVVCLLVTVLWCGGAAVAQQAGEDLAGALDEGQREKELTEKYARERETLLKATGEASERPKAGQDEKAGNENPVPRYVPGKELEVPESQSPVYQRAISLLLEAGTSQIPVLRANAIEALHPVPERVAPLVHKGLSDPNEGVRFVSVMSVGILKRGELVAAVRPLLRDQSDSVRAGALYALYVNGQRVDLTPLAGMLHGQDRVVRSNVAMILGLLGERSAVGLLKSAAKVRMVREDSERKAVMRLQIAEALAKLGETSEINSLRGALYNQFEEPKVAALNALGALGDRAMVPAIETFLYAPRPASTDTQKMVRPIEVKLAAAGALAKLGSSKGMEVVLEGMKHENPAIRMQAAWAMGWHKGEAARSALVEAMEDANAIVQLAAAAGIVRQSNADRLASQRASK